jgi:hypothetical protein
MIKNMYSILDTKSKTYGPVVFEVNHATVMRGITEELKNPQSTLAKYPEDFHLFYLGTFDDQTATFGLMEAPQNMCGLFELMPDKEQIPSSLKNQAQ